MSQSAENRHKDSNTKSVSKTLAILATFNETVPMQRTSDIAAKLHMNMSTVSRHLNTMLDWGFLERDDATGYYFPGLAIVALAGVTLQNNDVFRHAFPELQQLSYKYGIHSHMSVPRDTDIVHLISSCCESTMDLLIPMGHRHPMYCSAMGRVLLAWMPAVQAEDILRRSERLKYTSATKIDLHDINQELILTRQKGYCLLLNELTESKASIAAPIFDRNRTPVAAISVSASAHSLSQPQRQRELARAVVTTAGKISGKLGYFPK
ncbi:IclR family transcriptional regulator [Superficieibacter sp. HKU1]|uniref:IclR family transcriptional regulator n=1 Tax=Superficieibacter sp. HKU1 TaxID=3031919 RepID=UPI0023E29690|nr:IclR family transcriptional regulator [Superficieibacter sp. HKU1]WES69909.1 IclR family transcriptional regulator [Superficieibacter sp. HKU1]